MKLENNLFVSSSSTASTSRTDVDSAKSTAPGTGTSVSGGQGGFSVDSKFEAPGIWAGPDGRGCIPYPRFPLPQPIPYPRLPGPFPRPLPSPFPLPFPGRVTVSPEDRQNARGLREALSDPLNRLIGMFDPDAEEVTLHPDKNGNMQGPDGEPLIAVTLKNGQKAYVDPNTNQYYLAEREQPWGCFGRGGTVCRGPIDLPEEAQFSNSHFSDADCRSLEKTANRRRLWDFFPRPFPMPWFGVKQPRPELL